jgi:hypothetical protein
MAMAYTYTPQLAPAGGGGYLVYPHHTRWILKQAWLSEDMAVTDPLGNTVFRAKRKTCAMGWNLNLYDGPSGAPIGQVKQKTRLGMGTSDFSIFLGGTIKSGGTGKFLIGNYSYYYYFVILLFHFLAN